MTKLQRLWYMTGRCTNCGQKRESSSRKIRECQPCRATQQRGIAGMRARSARP